MSGFSYRKCVLPVISHDCKIFIYLFNLLIHLFNLFIIYLFIYFVYLFIFLFIHSFNLFIIYLFIYFVYLFTDLFIYSFIYLFLDRQIPLPKWNMTNSVNKEEKVVLERVFSIQFFCFKISPIIKVKD